VLNHNAERNFDSGLIVHLSSRLFRDTQLIKKGENEHNEDKTFL